MKRYEVVIFFIVEFLSLTLMHSLFVSVFWLFSVKFLTKKDDLGDLEAVGIRFS